MVVKLQWAMKKKDAVESRDDSDILLGKGQFMTKASQVCICVNMLCSYVLRD